MRFLISLTILLFIHQHPFAQVVDGAPSGHQNTIPVEGGSIRMKIDSVTPLKQLIARLNGDWEFYQTGKGYWIGYTDDMFSIASRGDAAIPALMDFFKNTKKSAGKLGVIYTLHLIGIDRKIAGRWYEEFVNEKARSALLKLLKEEGYTYTVMKLLMRDPWDSDLPFLFDFLQSGASEEACWPLVNALDRYLHSRISKPRDFETPVRNDVPDSLENLEINLKVDDENSFGPDFDFTGQIKEALREFEHRYPNKIVVEERLYREELSRYYKTKLPGTLSIGIFLWCLEIGHHDATSFSNTGVKMQYYVEDGKMYFCTINTARERFIKWWNRERG